MERVKVLVPPSYLPIGRRSPSPDTRISGISKINSVEGKWPYCRFLIVHFCLDRTISISLHLVLTIASLIESTETRLSVPGVNLDYYVGGQVGVVGTSRYIPKRQARHVMAKHVTPLETARR